MSQEQYKADAESWSREQAALQANLAALSAQTTFLVLQGQYKADADSWSSEQTALQANLAALTAQIAHNTCHQHCTRTSCTHKHCLQAIFCGVTGAVQG